MAHLGSFHAFTRPAPCHHRRIRGYTAFEDFIPADDFAPVGIEEFLRFGNDVTLQALFRRMFLVVLQAQLADFCLALRAFFPTGLRALVSSHVDVLGGENFYQFNMPVRIGRNCWLGAGAIILPGVTIGEGCVIGAKSVVTKSLPPYVLAYGNPCRIISAIEKEEDDKNEKSVLNIKELFLMAVATSIDAFAVGLSLALTNTGIVFPALVIGIVCAAISAGGVHLGATLSRLRIINRFSEILGGLALLGIGLNILRQSL